jgi:GR25 family glycosyltransferase involved in LPS biosynthesis
MLRSLRTHAWGVVAVTTTLTTPLSAAPEGGQTPQSERVQAFQAQLDQPLPPAPFDHLLRQGIEAHPCGLASVDSCFVINLDCRRGRWQRMQTQMAEYGVVPSRVSAVVGAKLSNEDLASFGLRWEPGMRRVIAATFINGEKRVGATKPQAGTWFMNSPNLGRGALGCYLSHLSIWQGAWEMGLQRIWVLEDDVELLKSKHVLEARIAELDQRVGPEGWDILYTDPDPRRGLNPLTAWICGTLPKRPDFASQHKMKRTPLSDALETVSARYGTYSMVLNRSALQKLLTFFRHYGLFGPIDGDLHLVPGLREFVCRDPVVTNCVAGVSDIQHEHVRKGPVVEPGDDPNEVYATFGLPF